MTIKKNYKKFYKLQINVMKLLDNKLMVLYETGSPFSRYIKTRTISPEFASVLLNLIDTNELNYEMIKRLTEEEKKLFNIIMTQSGAKTELKYKEPELTEEDLLKRFELLQGSIQAGNNSNEVLKEGIDILKRLNKIGRIDDEQLNEILNSLE